VIFPELTPKNPAPKDVCPRTLFSVVEFRTTAFDAFPKQ
jgi:hypothetical protein